jgi:preprotein translocase subunit SecD
MYMKFFTLALCLLGATSCIDNLLPKSVEKDGGLILEVRFADTMLSNEAKNRVAEIVSNRMNAAFVWDPVTELTTDGNGLHIELPLQDSVELFSELATKPGRFEIVECYTYHEINMALYEIDGKIAAMPEYAGLELPLFSRYLILNSDSNFANIGFVSDSISSEFETLLNSDWVSKILPLNAKPTLMIPQQGMCVFFVLKYPASGLAPITGDMIEQASVSDGYEDTFDVDFRFAEPFHETWARLTRENIGLNLAIVIDGKVYSAPTVNDEITGGRCVISGNFTTIEEAGFISAIISSGELPTPLEVVSSKVITKE